MDMIVLSCIHPVNLVNPVKEIIVPRAYVPGLLAIAPLELRKKVTVQVLKTKEPQSGCVFSQGFIWHNLGSNVSLF